jgi:hypothetical protein
MYYPDEVCQEIRGYGGVFGIDESEITCIDVRQKRKLMEVNDGAYKLRVA